MDRALSELRAGRPIVIETPGGPAVVAALDAVAPSVLDAFTRLGDGNRFLVLSLERARVLGLAAHGPVAVSIGHLENEAVYRLATGVDALASADWGPAGAGGGARLRACE